jgi:hypothetical protein
MQERNELIILRDLRAEEGSGLGSKRAKRREKKLRNTDGTIETLHDALENSLLGNPIDENVL